MAPVVSDVFQKFSAAKDVRQEIQKEIANLETGVCSNASHILTYAAIHQIRFLVQFEVVYTFYF